VKSTDDCESVAPGRYVLTRKVEIDGRLRSRRIECSNPAFGFARLDEWEALERALTVEALNRIIDERPLQWAKIRKR
jgi:hypothetical protein